MIEAEKSYPVIMQQIYKIHSEFDNFFKIFHPPVAASNNAHSHLSRSPQYGHLQ